MRAELRVVGINMLFGTIRKVVNHTERCLGGTWTNNICVATVHFCLQYAAQVFHRKELT